MAEAVSDPAEVSGPAEPAERRVTWAELYFDLVFVFAVTEVAALLYAEPTWLGLGRALAVLGPIYWTWVGTVMRTNIADLSSARSRLLIFTIAFGALVMGLAVPHAFGSTALVFAVTYWIVRSILGVMTLHHGRMPVTPYPVSMAVTGPLLVVGALLHGDAQLALWALAATVDLSSPTVLRARMQWMHFEPSHLAERFGLFVLIAIGESVVAVGAPAASAEHLSAAELAAAAAAFALSAGLWWVYFHFAADAIRHAMATAQVQLDIARHVLSYGHFLFIAMIIGVGVGLRDVMADPTGRLGWAGAGLLFGAAAGYLATFGYTRWEMFRLVSWTRLTGAVVVLVVLPLGAVLPALAAVTLLALLLAGLNVVEARRVATAGGL